MQKPCSNNEVVDGIHVSKLSGPPLKVKNLPRIYHGQFSTTTLRSSISVNSKLNVPNIMIQIKHVLDFILPEKTKLPLDNLSLQVLPEHLAHKNFALDVLHIQG